MCQAETARVGYVLKRYPRYSETFVVNEVLAHEAAGLPVDIISTLRSNDGHFQDCLAYVRAAVHYLPSEQPKSQDFWMEIGRAMSQLPDLADSLEVALGHPARDVYQAIHLAYHVRARKITHLHAHFASTATSITRLAARFAKVPFTFTAHAKDIFHNSVSADDLRKKLEDASAVVTVSDFNRDFLQATYGVAAEKVCRIYNGLDLDKFRFVVPKQRAPRVLAAGRLVEKKGFGTLVDACALVARTGRNFTCEIVGTGVLEAALQAQIKQLGLDDIVHLLGPRPQMEMIDLMRTAAVLAAPCTVAADQDRDGLPTILLEAMALGTPCVSTDVTGIPEVVRHGETGLVVPERDAKSLAAAIARLLDDAALRVSLATEARRLIEDHFDIRHNAARLRDLFERIAHPEARPRLTTLREAV
ncbi:MAG: glycosyltransferase family 4 protein [Planctomycetes bacterium]|nr:glycosyltransferase family 4 protein [Planctomycetota bacterium]